MRGMTNAPLSDYSKLRLLAITTNRDIFSGHDHDFFRDQFAALSRLGAQVFVIAYDKLERLLADPTSTLRATIKQFNPHAVIGMPYGYYALQIKDGVRNYVLDELQKPVIVMWDHIITHMYHYFFGAEKPDSPRESRAGMLARLKDALNHPLLRHYIPDTGHKKVIADLGLIANDKNFQTFVFPARKHFIDFGFLLEPSRVAPNPSPAFFGNIFLNATEVMSLRRHSFVPALEERLNAAKEANWNLPLWHAFSIALAEVDGVTRDSHRLSPDDSFYWAFAHDEVGVAATARHRERVLTSIKHPTTFYGGFADEKSMALLARHPNMRVARAIDYFVELPIAYASHTVVVDVVNCPFIHGTSPKFLDCYAAGGFNLIDYRQDIVDGLGEFSKLFMYANAEDLNAKIDFFLSHPKERAGVIAAVQQKIRKDWNYESFFARVLDGILAEGNI